MVTGGAGDIGSAVARALAAEGASVVIADVRDPEGTDLKRWPRGPGPLRARGRHQRGRLAAGAG
ncbi:NAD(P)-binding domain-containing protein [Streptomyces collinus]|uniref:NAD(P)-binding domain-containing protein n=1 Tax=Streptomyces collinus TaxID=42684 RepID=UPI00369EA8F2